VCSRILCQLRAPVLRQLCKALRGGAAECARAFYARCLDRSFASPDVSHHKAGHKGDRKQCHRGLGDVQGNYQKDRVKCTPPPPAAPAPAPVRKAGIGGAGSRATHSSATCSSSASSSTAGPPPPPPAPSVPSPGEGGGDWGCCCGGKQDRMTRLPDVDTGRSSQRPYLSLTKSCMVTSDH
jgi:hypothetical protein